MRTRLHALEDIIVLSLIAVMAGSNNWVEIEEFGHAYKPWLREFLPLSNGIPSHDTLGSPTCHALVQSLKSLKNLLGADQPRLPIMLPPSRFLASRSPSAPPHCGDVCCALTPPSAGRSE